MAARKACGVGAGVTAAVVAGVGEATRTRGVGDAVAVEEAPAHAGNVINATAASHCPLMPVPTVWQRLLLPSPRTRDGVAEWNSDQARARKMTGMHRRLYLLLASTALALMPAAAACGAASAPSTSASNQSTPVSATPVPAASLIPKASPALSDRLLVASLGIDVSFAEVSCDASATLVPLTTLVAYADCGGSGFLRFMGNDAGPLHSVRTAPDGTEAVWWDASGHAFRTVLEPVYGQPSDVNPPGITRNSDGTWPGHGVAGHPVYFAIRSSTLQYERQGKVTAS